MSQQRSEQGPTTAWGDPTRAAKPTMRQQMPWDEKSLEKNEGQSNPRLDPTKVKGSPSDPNAPEVLDAAARNRKRVAETAGEPAVTPYRTLPSGERGEREEKSLSKEVGGGIPAVSYANFRNPEHNKIQDNLKRTDGEAYAKLSPAERYTKVKGIHASSQPPVARRNPDLGPAPSLDARQKSLSKANPDPVEEGKAILAMPFNLATQMIMGKKAPNSVSADDRLKESVLILLKQQASAEEVGRDVIGSGAIKIGSKVQEQSTAPTTQPVGQAVKPVGATATPSEKRAKTKSDLASAGLVSAMLKAGKTTKPTNSSNV